MAEAATPATPAAAPAAKPADAGKPAAAAVDTKAPEKSAESEAKGYWPADWQSRLAGEDAAELKHIGKYASPEDVWKKARSLEKRMSSGEFKTVLPKDAKPEELAAWRKDNGIPETAAKYDLSGIEIDEDRKPIVDDFLKVAHEANMSPEQVRAAIQWRNGEIEREAQEHAARDDEQRTKTLDTLNEEWGGAFRRNVTLVNNMLERFPEDVREGLKNARMPDGTAIFNDPDVVKGFVALALEANPAGVIVPAGSGEPGKVAVEEYQDLLKYMGEHRAEYMKDNAKQARMITLIDFLSKQGLIDKNGNVKLAA